MPVCKMLTVDFPFDPDAEPEVSSDAATKVLFGMVVRERRRVAALAISASSLDERLQAAEKANNISEEVR